VKHAYGDESVEGRKVRVTWPQEVDGEAHARMLEWEAAQPGADRERLLKLARLARKGRVRYVPPGDG
jgi:hypothetical protein